MGLDMYLEKHTFIWTSDKENDPILQIVSNKYKHIKADRISNIIEEIGYWRKANHIHKWFVDHIQSGKDDCRDHYVSEEDMEKLLDLVNKVIANPEEGPSLLPTGEGFFFGGTDYDEYYMNDLKKTKEIIEGALKETEGEIYYSSSW